MQRALLAEAAATVQAAGPRSMLCLGTTSINPPANRVLPELGPAPQVLGGLYGLARGGTLHDITQ